MIDRRRKVPKAVPGALSVKSFHEEAERGDDGADMALLRRLGPYLKPHALLLTAAIVLMPLGSVASLFQPLMIKRAIDAAVVTHSRDALMQAVLFYGLITACEFVIRFTQTYTMQLAGQRAMADLRRAVFRKTQELRVGYFDRTPIGRVVTRVTNDVDSLSEFFGSGAVTALGDLVLLVGIVAFMLALDWQLSLVAFVALPPLALLIVVFRRYARDAFRAIRARVAQLNAFMGEQVQGIAVVQAFSREQRCMDEFVQINDAYREANQRSIKFDALLYSVVESVATASIAMLLYYAAVRAGMVEHSAQSAAYVGTVVAFYEYIQRFFIPIRDLSTKYTIIQSSLASAERIFGLIDTKEDDAKREPNAPAAMPPKPGVAIEIDDVTFAYRAGFPVLNDVSIDIRRGETVAIVGATGSGKTTTTALLLRLYEIGSGSIRIDGRDIRDFDRHELRRLFAVVPQDVFLFTGTVLDNIALGDAKPDGARAKECLERVGAWDLVASRPDGLHTTVDERGANFSAGERQLLAFARALYRDPPFLILDEATANIDSESEARLQEAVQELVKARTAIVIAHRLSTIRTADRVVVFQKGRIVEQGSESELLAQGGVYAKLHALQFAAAEEPVASGATA